MHRIVADSSTMLILLIHMPLWDPNLEPACKYIVCHSDLKNSQTNSFELKKYIYISTAVGFEVSEI